MFFSKWYTRLAKRLLFLLIPYSIVRIGFLFYHLNIYKQFTQDELFQSLLLGVRFDIAAICLINIPIILLSLIPSTNPKFLKFERSQFALINTTGFILALNDYELFLFMGKRLSFDIFAVSNDIIDQLPQMFLYYWYLPIAAIAFGVGVYFFDKNVFKLKEGKRRPWLHAVGGVFVLGLCFIGIRGGLQHKSINVQSAFVQGKNELGHLVLNTPYHFFRTLKNRRLAKVSYFKTDDEARNIILNARDFKPGFDDPKKYNVVVLILESFSLEYVERGYAPFLEQLAKTSLSLPKHLANGRRSIEVLPSVFCGLPSLIDEPLSKSTFSGNRFVCLPKILKQEGYTNYFFHGGARGTMGFEAYTLANGFDRYFAKEDYPGDDFDGTWGIYDGPYLQYAVREISQMKKPFMAGIFTLSSHQPYSVPENLKGKFKKGNLEIHESIGYTDHAVEEFFKLAKKEPWFKDTIFVITADHTQKLETKKYQNLVGHYRVPMLIHVPGTDLGTVDKVTQHSDIPLTILDMLGVKTDEMAAVGSSVFSGDVGVGVNYADGATYFLVKGDEVQMVDKLGNGSVARIDWESGDMSDPVASEDQLLKAYLQYFMNGLINNNLSIFR
jgi:phosphoglycerol transferase MdoB-like AlkP superfamily enzyme